MEIRGAEDLKLLGFFGIYEEAFKIIISWRQIFTKIAFFLILPLSFIFLANIQIPLILFADILDLGLIMQGISPLPKSINDDPALTKFVGFLIFIIGNHFLALIISMLSTSAIIYTVACVYINDTADLTFSKVINVIPQVMGNRLISTFLWNFVIQIGYHVVCMAMSIILISSFVMLLSSSLSSSYVIMISTMLVIFLAIDYMTGFTYINVIWHLSCVVSVLEEDVNLCGIKAMKRSQALVNGNLRASSIIFITLNICLTIIQVASLRTGYKNESATWGIIGKVMYEIMCLLLIMLVILVGLVTQCVIYFVCKSYNNEIIDKTSLRNHLKLYLADSVDLEEQEYGNSTSKFNN